MEILFPLLEVQRKSVPVEFETLHVVTRTDLFNQRHRVIAHLGSTVVEADVGPGPDGSRLPLKFGMLHEEPAVKWGFRKWCIVRVVHPNADPRADPFLPAAIDQVSIRIDPLGGHFLEVMRPTSQGLARSQFDIPEEGLIVILFRIETFSINRPGPARIIRILRATTDQIGRHMSSREIVDEFIEGRGGHLSGRVEHESVAVVFVEEDAGNGWGRV